MAKTNLLATLYMSVLVGAITGTCRPSAERMPTITVLPDLPKVPISGIGLSTAEKDVVIQTLVNHKLSTYPAASSRSHRVGKFTSTGIFGGFPPTEEQIARLAPHYDNILFGAARWEGGYTGCLQKRSGNTHAVRQVQLVTALAMMIRSWVSTHGLT